MSASQLIRISAPHFVAGVLIASDGRVIRTAPIVKYMLGWDRERVLSYAASKGWEAA